MDLYKPHADRLVTHTCLFIIIMFGLTTKHTIILKNIGFNKACHKGRWQYPDIPKSGPKEQHILIVHIYTCISEVNKNTIFNKHTMRFVEDQSQNNIL